MAIMFGVSCGLAQAASAEDFEWPARKPGQWEVHMKASKDMPEITVQMCLDAATDKGMMQMGMGLAKSMCPEQKIAREGDKIIIDSTCSVAGVKMQSRTEISGDFNSEYTMVSKGDIADAPEGMAGKTDVEQRARWVSAACSDGMQPGDMEMPGGIKMNIQKMMGMMESLGGGAAP